VEDRPDPSWGQVVTVLRVIRGWNRRQLATATSMSESAISRYEEGSRPAPLGRLVAAMGFPPHLADRTMSFLRWASAASEQHPGAGTLAAPGRIEVIATELGLWLERVAREGLAAAADPSSEEGPAAASGSPPWWHKPRTPPSAGRRASLENGPRSTPLAQSIVILRLLRRWSRQELADAISTSETTIANWEKGKTRPRVAMLDRAVDAMAFPPAMLGRTLAFVESARAAREWHLAGGILKVQAADLAARAAESLEGFVRTTISFLVSAARLLASRSEAAELWARFRACSESVQRDLAREAAEYHTAGFVELLCEESRKAAGDSAARALHLARCAAAAAAAAPGNEGWRSRLQGYVDAHLANALRVGGDLREADRAFGHARELWEAGAGDDPGLLNGARFLHLEASLRRGQRRVREALALLDQALALDRWGETPTLFMSKARALEELGQYEQAVALLLRLDSQLDAGSEPRGRYVVRGQLVSNFCHLGRYGEAAIALGELRVLARRLGNQLDQLRVEWLHGRVAAGLGRSDDAIAALSRVRDAFMAQNNAYDAALATLQLAEVHATLRRTAEVQALARASAPIFRDQGVHKEARRALELFHRGGAGECRAGAPGRYLPLPLPPRRTFSIRGRGMVAGRASAYLNRSCAPVGIGRRAFVE
jgi:transcriptional regulator with XRE-family HTH domain